MDNNNGLTYEQLKEALSALPYVPAFSDLSFVENKLLPENTIMVSHKIMELLKNIFNNGK